MKINLIIGQYNQSYPGQLAPNVLGAWDEFVLEDNYDGYQRELDDYKAQVGTDFEAVEVLVIEVPDQPISQLVKPPAPAPTPASIVDAG